MESPSITTLNSTMFLLRSEKKYLKRLAKSGSKFHYVSIKIVDEVSKPHLDDISKFHYVSIKIYERHIKQSYIFTLNSNVVLLLLLLPRIRIPGLLPLDSNVVLLLREIESQYDPNSML